jgi:hypothetical protein
VIEGEGEHQPLVEVALRLLGSGRDREVQVAEAVEQGLYGRGDRMRWRVVVGGRAVAGKEEGAQRTNERGSCGGAPHDASVGILRGLIFTA